MHKVIEMKKISVAIATYNGEEYLWEQLTSIGNQTVLPDQIVISDDHSTDRTASIITRFMSEYESKIGEIIFVQNESDTGITGNFENALSHSDGFYVFLADQDDIWLPEKIEEMIKIMDSSDAVLSYSNAEVIIKSGNEFVKTGELLFNGSKSEIVKVVNDNNSFLLNHAGENCFIQGMCTCVRGDFLKKIYPFSRIRNHDDWIESCSLVFGKVIEINKVLAYYRIHENNNVGIQSHVKQSRLSKINKLKKYNKNSIESIRSQHQFWTEFSDVLSKNDINIDDLPVSPISEFYKDKRIHHILGNRIKGTIKLYDIYKSGLSSSYSRPVLIRDLYLLWGLSKEKKEKILENSL